MVTLTGTFTRLDGTPASGTVRVTPSRSPILDSDGKIVISGPQTFPLDKDGKLTVQIPASNDPDLGPAFTYSIDVNLTHASWKISKVWIPHGSTTVDLSEIGDYQPVPGVATRVVTIPADGADGQVLVWDGAGFSWEDVPEGPRGPIGPQGPAIDVNTGLPIQVDTTVGTRVLIDGVMVHGDTGRRTIARWDTTGTLVYGDPGDFPGWQRRAGSSEEARITAQRINNDVSIRFWNLEMTASGSNVLIPSQFMLAVQNLTTTSAVARYPTPTHIYTLVGNALLYITGAVGLASDDRYPIEFRFPALGRAWPSSLPGLPD